MYLCIYTLKILGKMLHYKQYIILSPNQANNESFDAGSENAV